MKSAKHKGDVYELKSRRLLEQDGYYVFEGKSVGGFDLIAVRRGTMPYQCEITVVEVTTPAHRARARGKLRTLPAEYGFGRQIHLWYTTSAERPRIITVLPDGREEESTPLGRRKKAL